MRYLDKNQREIKAGDIIKCDTTGECELVVRTVDIYGDEDLGINASDIDYLRVHRGASLQHYSLSSFYTHTEWEIVGTKDTAYSMLSQRKRDLIEGNY